MFILYKEVINASIAFNQICGSSAVLMDGEQPFLALNDERLLLYWTSSKTQRKDGYVCILMNAFSFRYVAADSLCHKYKRK